MALLTEHCRYRSLKLPTNFQGTDNEATIILIYYIKCNNNVDAFYWLLIIKSSHINSNLTIVPENNFFDLLKFGDVFFFFYLIKEVYHSFISVLLLPLIFYSEHLFVEETVFESSISRKSVVVLHFVVYRLVLWGKKSQYIITSVCGAAPICYDFTPRSSASRKL